MDQVLQLKVEDITHTYSQLIFDNEERIYNEEKTVSLTSGVGKAGEPHVNQ